SLRRSQQEDRLPRSRRRPRLQVRQGQGARRRHPHRTRIRETVRITVTPGLRFFVSFALALCESPQDVIDACNLRPKKKRGGAQPKKKSQGHVGIRSCSCIRLPWFELLCSENY